MKLLENIRNWLENRNSAQAPVLQRAMSLSQAWLAAEENDYGAGAKLHNALQQSVWVYGCVTAISEQLSDIPFAFSLGERAGERRVSEGPVVDLFNQPDPLMNRFMFWDLVCQWMLLRGKCYLVALDRNGLVVSLRGGGSLPARLVLLNPDRVRPMRAGHELLGYHYQAAPNDPIGNQSFLAEEVVNLRMAYAYDYLEGLPPLGVALLAAQTDYASAQMMKGLVLNNADSGLIVTTPESLNSEQKTQILAALRERKRAAGTADRPLFLTDKCKVQAPPLALADLQFLENRKFNRQEICAIFRVPQEVLGYTEDANRAVAESVRLGFIEHRIVPFCRRLEAAVEPIVKLFGRDVWGWFDWETLPSMQAARRLRYQSAREGFEMGVPLNVLNQVFDLGLPRLAHGDVSFLPGNLQQTTEAQRHGGERKMGNEGRDALGKLEGLLKVVDAAGAGEKAWQDVMVRSLAGKFSKFFFEQRGRTLARIGNAETVFDVRREDELLVERMGPVLGSVLEQCVREREVRAARAKDAPGFALSAADKAAFVEEREVALREINQATWAALREVAGLGMKGVKGVFQVAGDCRARELAEQEVSLARSYVENIEVLGVE